MARNDFAATSGTNRYRTVFQEYLYSSGAPKPQRTELMRMVRGGSDLPRIKKLKLSNSERIAQGIVALANTGGGVGVFESTTRCA
jgi:hypothetical protein